MIERQLSNHANSYLVEAEQREEQARADQRSAIEAQHHAAAVRDAAKRNTPWWRRLIGLKTADERVAVELMEHHRQIALGIDRDVNKAQADRARANQGQLGERVLPNRFGARLSDQWRMFHGCYNSKGEIDHLLLGPPGLWAVEVKTHRAKLLVFDDDWALTKLDRWGNEVERTQAADNSGRNWGRQVGEPAAVLQKRLAAKGYNIPVNTAVVMVAPHAKIVDVIQPGVSLVTASVEEFDRMATTGPPVLDREQLNAIDDLIVEHHQHFNK